MGNTAEGNFDQRMCDRSLLNNGRFESSLHVDLVSCSGLSNRHNSRLSYGIAILLAMPVEWTARFEKRCLGRTCV